jgi:hypothetical protein
MTITVTITATDQEILTWKDQIMATFAEMSAKIDALSATTATIKSEIDALVAAKAGGGMTADEEAQIDAKLDTLTTALGEAAAAGA